MVEIKQKFDKSQSDRSDADESIFSALDGLRWRMHNRSRLWRPPMDIYETETELVVRIEIAGMQEEDFKVVQKGRVLSIAGVRADLTERRAYHQMEIPFGEFLIELELPVHVDEKSTFASYQQGFLKIILPKVQPSQIHIEENH